MSHPRETLAITPLAAGPAARPTARLRSILRRLAAVMFLVALAACQSGEQSGQAGEPPAAERKNPFATGNVSVAPQIEGRAAAPTPVPAPRPTLEP